MRTLRPWLKPLPGGVYRLNLEKNLIGLFYSAHQGSEKRSSPTGFGNGLKQGQISALKAITTQLSYIGPNSRKSFAAGKPGALERLL